MSKEASKEHGVRDKLVLAVELGVLAAGAYQLMRHREDAEDLLQDTYEKVLKGLPNFKGDSEFKTWAYRIMINRALDIKGLAKRREEPYEPGYFEYGGMKAVEQDRAFDAADFSETLELIGQLKPIEQTVVLMHASGYKYKEIAEHLEMPLGTVKNHDFRGRKRLEELKAA